MKTCKVMIVDDEVTILEGFHKLFDWEAYNCEIVGDAMDGISAVQMADKRNPDLIIMDINIPMMNGMEAVRTIKAKHEKMQFIIVTGYDDFGYCQEALRLDVADYILKPVDFDELGTVIERVQKKMEAQPSWNVEERDSEGKIIYQIIGFLNEHIREDISLTMLSRAFHLNSSTYDERR